MVARTLSMHCAPGFSNDSGLNLKDSLLTISLALSTSLSEAKYVSKYAN